MVGVVRKNAPIRKHYRSGQMAEAAMVAYDTHKAVRKLTDSGMPPEQAEAIVDEHFRIFVEHMATREDVNALRGDIRVLEEKIEQLRLKIEVAANATDAKIERLTNRMYVVVITVGGLIIASQHLL